MATILWASFFFFVMYISDAKFDEQCSYISRDILYSVSYRFRCKRYDPHRFPNLHNTKASISLKRKKMFRKGKRHSFVF